MHDGQTVGNAIIESKFTFAKCTDTQSNSWLSIFLLNIIMYANYINTLTFDMDIITLYERNKPYEPVIESRLSQAYQKIEK